MTDLLESRAVGKLAQYLGHALVRVREEKGFNQKQLRAAVNQWRTEHYGATVKKVGSGTLSDAENGVSNFEIGTLEDAIASIQANPLDLILQAYAVAVSEQKGTPLWPVKRRRRGGQPGAGQGAAPSNTAGPGPFPVSDDASDLKAEPFTSERMDMTDKSPQQRLMFFVNSLEDDKDAAAAYDGALKAVAARRSLHESDLSGSGET